MTYSPPFEIVNKPSQLDNAWRRTFAPRVLQVVHVTGNSRVAAYPEGFGSGESPGADWAYAAKNPASAGGPSAHNYVGRKTGATIEMWNPATHVAWSNGDLDHPNVKLPGVKYLADLRARGVNANKGCYREIELSGYPGSYDPTNAQIEVAAYFAAKDSIATGIDIIRGETMLTHGDINPIDRSNCAFRPAIREPRMRDIIDRALEIRALLLEVDVAGLALANFILAPGFARVKAGLVGVQAVQTADRERFTFAAGEGKPVIGTATLLGDPLGKLSTLGAEVYVIGGPGIEQAIFFAKQVDFEADGDATPYSKADLDAAVVADRAKARVTWA